MSAKQIFRRNRVCRFDWWLWSRFLLYRSPIGSEVDVCGASGSSLRGGKGELRALGIEERHREEWGWNRSASFFSSKEKDAAPDDDSLGITYDQPRSLLKTNLGLKIIFIDPARRDDAGNKVVSLKDCTPDVTVLQEEMLSKADYVIIKLSPMLDWHRAISELSHVREVHIISVNNECKELLLVLSARNMGEMEASSADGEVKHAGNLRIYCINDAQSFVCDELDMESSQVKIAPSTLEEMLYLYEPNASLMKAGCFGVLSGRYDARMLSKNSHLFVSREPIAAFPGRSFRIIAVSSFNKRS